MKLILGFSGQIGSGKGTVTGYIVKKYNASYYRFSNILREVSDFLRIEKSRDNLQDLSTILRKRFGEDLLIKIIFEKVKEDTNEIIVIDGIRLADDLQYLQTFSEFRFVYIEADPRVRYERMLTRNENPGDAEKTFEQFIQDQYDEADVQIKSLKTKADFVIGNDGTLAELYSKIDSFIGTMR